MSRVSQVNKRFLIQTLSFYLDIHAEGKEGEMHGKIKIDYTVHKRQFC